MPKEVQKSDQWKFCYRNVKGKGKTGVRRPPPYKANITNENIYDVGCNGELFHSFEGKKANKKGSYVFRCWKPEDESFCEK